MYIFERERVPHLAHYGLVLLGTSNVAEVGFDNLTKSLVSASCITKLPI